MNKRGFTLIELMIVVTIVALASVFSFTAFRNNLNKAEFDDVVSDVIAIFQEARSYSVKNATIDEDTNSTYTVENVAGMITLSGDVSGEIESYDFTDEFVEFESDWTVTYEAPYGDFDVTDVEGDLSFTISSTKGDQATTIVVHDLSGIAEEE